MMPGNIVGKLRQHCSYTCHHWPIVLVEGIKQLSLFARVTLVCYQDAPDRAGVKMVEQTKVGKSSRHKKKKL